MLEERVTAEIRAELGRQDLTQQELAEALGWSATKLNRKLKGKTRWSIADVEQVSDYLDVPILARSDSNHPVTEAS